MHACGESNVCSATVREWLAAEGLPQYIDLFEQNRIELDELPT